MKKILTTDLYYIFNGEVVVSLPSFSKILDIIVDPYNLSFRVIYEIDNSRIITPSDFINTLWIKFIKISEILHNNEVIIGSEYEFIKRVDNIGCSSVFSGTYNQVSITNITELNIPESILIYTNYVKCQKEVRSDKLKNILKNDFSSC